MNSTTFGKYLCDLRWFMYNKDEGIKSGSAISCGPKCSEGWQRRREVVDEEWSFQDKQEVSALLKALSSSFPHSSERQRSKGELITATNFV